MEPQYVEDGLQRLWPLKVQRPKDPYGLDVVEEDRNGRHPPLHDDWREVRTCPKEGANSQDQHGDQGDNDDRGRQRIAVDALGHVMPVHCPEASKRSARYWR